MTGVASAAVAGTSATASGAGSAVDGGDGASRAAGAAVSRALHPTRSHPPQAMAARTDDLILMAEPPSSRPQRYLSRGREMGSVLLDGKMVGDERMARTIRIEFPGAMYHVIVSGNEPRRRKLSVEKMRSPSQGRPEALGRALVAWAGREVGGLSIARAAR
ncbi:MAG: hypothetical protein M3547_04480, partial [Acidobacteriota bacterium]|nr:hypothetical protein [Acidobacteriota bacterium]